MNSGKASRKPSGREQGIRRLILDYIRHIGRFDLQKAESVAAILSQSGFNRMISIVMAALHRRDREGITNALCFLRDLYLSPALDLRRKRTFMAEMEECGLYLELETGLYRRDYRIRAESIYTTGKLTNQRYLGNLIRALEDRYLRSDPYLAPALIFEINWLARARRHDWMERMVAHPHYLFRWSALELDNCYDFKDRRIARMLRRFRNITLQTGNASIGTSTKPAAIPGVGWNSIAGLRETWRYPNGPRAPR